MARSASRSPPSGCGPAVRLRAGCRFVAVENGHVIGTVRLWEVSAGPDRAALLLGPLAVDPAQRRRGIGSALMRHALRAAAKAGHRAVLLAGDAAYYSRFGFSAERTGALWLPGLADKTRLLGRELTAGALDGVRGAIRVPKRPIRTPLVAAIGRLAQSRAA